MSEHPPLRFGVLGAARIAPMALVRPAKEVPEATIAAVAARDPKRARAFATKHGIPRVHATYDALLADPELDAIYNPLPNALHCQWTIKALEAGKHVLCEKPLAANAREAERMAQAAERTGRVLVEAFHYRYHPLATRMREIIDSGCLGDLRHVEAQLCFPLAIPGDIRYRYDLAGGATMDVGCYTINMVRFLAGAEPRVTDARALLASPQVDRRMQADFEFDGRCTGRMVCSLFSRTLLRVRLEARGTEGSMRVFNPILPQLYHRLTVRTAAGKSVERVPGDGTYTCQLRAFVRTVHGEPACPTDARSGVANMRVIDAVYEKAGLRLRGQ